MDLLIIFGILAFSYLVGSIPFGLVVVKIAVGKDVRSIGSGRIGGTNVMRAAGVLAGGITALLDLLKGGAGIWLAGWLLPGQVWVQVAAGVLGIWGSIHSIFLREKDETGKIHLRGGAGGATTFGAVTALWLSSPVILFPIAALVYIFIGYASVTTISIAVAGTIILAVRAIFTNAPWEYIAMGIISIAMVIYALRPNLKRLREGTEREVGLRAYLTRMRQSKLKSRPRIPPKSTKFPLSPSQPFRASPKPYREG